MIFNFRNWVLENFPFIEDDFDALTDYELFSKVCEYIKNYQKEFERIEKEIKDFEDYISKVDITKTVNEILDVELPLLENTILNQVDNKLQALETEINTSIENLSNNIDASLEVLSSRIASVENGNIEVYNPTNGHTTSLNEALQDITGMIINTIPTAITCLEFDALELSATAYDAYELTALDFDLDAKELLV